MEASGFAVWDVAAFNGFVDIAKLLVEHNVDASWESPKDHLRPIHRTVWGMTQEHLQVMKLLIDNGLASANDLGGDGMRVMDQLIRTFAPGKHRRPPVMSTEERNVKRDMVYYLFTKGAREIENVRDNDQARDNAGLKYSELNALPVPKTPSKAMAPKRRNFRRDPQEEMLEAVQRIDPDWVEYEILRDPSVLNAKEPSTGQTGLMTACLQGSVMLVEKFIELGADPTATESGGYTPIHGSAFHGHKHIARVLIDKLNIDPNDMHSDGYRPIHRAAWGTKTRHADYVRYLLQTGKVDADSKTQKGQTVLQMMASNKNWFHFETAKVLKEFGADVSKLTAKQKRDLQLVVDEDDEELSNTCRADLV